MASFIKYSSKIAFFLIWNSLLFSCTRKKEFIEPLIPTVEVRYQDGRAMLYRHGEPYFIKGAAGSEHMEKVAAYGGNSIRTWSLHDADYILDKAHELGLTVTLGLEIGRPYWGADFNYWKFWEVDKKIEELRPLIEKYKDHPALLMWGVGNEVYLFGREKRFLVYFVINRVAKMIKEVDPNHPTMTAVPVPTNKNRFGSFRHIMPHVDIKGFNSFDFIDRLHDRVYEKKGWGKAYILSEWGPTGHWETTDTEWGAPKELTMAKKVELMESYWETLHKDKVYFLGSYAFYWGFKHEITHTWFSMFSEEGYESDQIKFLKYAWSGEKSENKAPIISHMSIGLDEKMDNVYLYANEKYSAKVITDAHEHDDLSFRWELRQEEYNYREKGMYQHNMKYYFLEDSLPKIEFIAPKQEGDYRLFVFVFDNNGNYTTQNIPFYVLKR